MAFKLLITECQTSLSDSICRGLEELGFSVLRPVDEQLDWTDLEALNRYIDEHRPALLINTRVCLGYQWLTENFRAAAVVDACRQHQIPCLHLSSFQVFGTGGCQPPGLGEQDTPAPDDDIGRLLCEVEEQFLAHDQAIVLRLPWLVLPEGDNIFTRIVERLASDDPLAASDIARGCPVTVEEVRRVVNAMALQVLCGAQNWGVLHLHTSDSCSEAELADYLARLLEKEGRSTGEIEILRNQEYRLVEGCGLLTGNRCMNNFGIQLRSWRQGMREVLQQWLELQTQRE